jgi:hypothetical protein
VLHFVREGMGLGKHLAARTAALVLMVGSNEQLARIFRRGCE